MKNSRIGKLVLYPPDDKKYAMTSGVVVPNPSNTRTDGDTFWIRSFDNQSPVYDGLWMAFDIGFIENDFYMVREK